MCKLPAYIYVYFHCYDIYIRYNCKIMHEETTENKNTVTNVIVVDRMTKVFTLSIDISAWNNYPFKFKKNTTGPLNSAAKVLLNNISHKE